MKELPYINTNIDPIVIDGRRYYLARSVGAHLGLSMGVTQLVRNLCQSDWRYEKNPTRRGAPMIYLTERGFYKLLLEHSNKKQVEFFKNWICGQVLPSILKDGKYNLY